MVKIIKLGELPQEKVYNITCKNCNTVFEFIEKEASIINSYRNEPTSLQIMCPLCKKYCYVDKKYK